MAPAKTPVFAVCGSMTTASEPSRGFSRPRKKPPPPLSCPPHHRSSAVDPLAHHHHRPSPSPIFTLSSDDLYSDVFGGPPKYAALSSQFSQLSLKRGASRVSDDASTDTLPTPSTDADESFASVRGSSSPQVGFSSEARNLGLRSARSDFVNLRPTTDAEVALPSCCRDNGRKDQLEGIKITSAKGNDTLSLDPSKESTTASNPLTRGTSPLNGSKTESSPRVPSVEKNCDRAQKYACSPCNMKMESRRFNRKDTIKGNINEYWITVKDVRFATEPSRFPPPSRPPPELSTSGDNYASTNVMEEHIKRVNDTVEITGQNLDEGSNFMFRFEESDRMHYKIDAVEMAEVKLKVAMEAKKKARLIVEKRLREKRRERHHKNMNDPTNKINKEQWCKNVSKARTGIHERLHCDEEANFENRETVKMQEPKNDASTASKGTTRSDTTGGTDGVNTSDQLLGEGTPVSELSSKSNGERAEMTPGSGQHLFEKSDNETLGRCIEKELKMDASKCDASESGEKQQDSSIRNSGQSLDNKDTDAKYAVSAVVDVHRDLSSARGSMSAKILFPAIEGETVDRRKTRWELTSARMAKALEEKKLRDLEIEREQTERHRAGEMLDGKIKNWAAGKEGNLQALLCSLQYILWPECGWQPVSPADVSTVAALKKSYRKATLCVHPDKLQQRGATIMQKYIAEKVFDLLKEASFRSM